MNITMAPHLPSVARTNPRAAVSNAPKQNLPDVGGDNVTLSYRSSNERRLITTASVLGGAALGGYLLNSATSGLTGGFGTAVNTITGAVGGAAALGITGGILAAATGKNRDGWDGLFRGYAGLAVGGAVGAIGGGIAAAMNPGTLSTVLTCAAGALVGGTLGGFVAKGINN